MSVLEMPGSRPAQAGNAREISRRQMRHLTRNVDDLLDVQRILSGKIVLQSAPVNLGELLRICLEAKRLVDAGNHAWEPDIETAWVSGGQVAVHSEGVGRSCTFTVSLPQLPGGAALDAGGAPAAASRPTLDPA